MKWQNPWFDARRPHHTSEGFRNLVQGENPPGALQRWRDERKASGLPLPPVEGYPAFQDKWWQPADFSTQDDAVWWLGHATLLLRLNGLNLLTDPVFRFALRHFRLLAHPAKPLCAPAFHNFRKLMPCLFLTITMITWMRVPSDSSDVTIRGPTILFPWAWASGSGDVVLSMSRNWIGGRAGFGKVW